MRCLWFNLRLAGLWRREPGREGDGCIGVIGGGSEEAGYGGDERRLGAGG